MWFQWTIQTVYMDGSADVVECHSVTLEKRMARKPAGEWEQ